MRLGTIAKGLAARLSQMEAQGLWLTPSSHAEEALLRRRHKKGDLVSPFRGMYARKASFEAASVRERHLRTIRTLATLHPSWVFCSYSAAALHGLQVPNCALDSVHCCANGRSTAGSSLVRHRLKLKRHDTMSKSGIQVTSLRKTIVDCLCAADFQTGLAIADSAIHWGLTSKIEIARWIDEDGAGRRGVRQARITALYADGRSDNGGESIARAVMIELGFAVPELQVEMFDPMEPGNPKRGDFGWQLDDGRWIIGELDGMVKYRGNGRHAPQDIDAAIRIMSAERRRESHLNLGGYTVVRFSMREVFDRAYFEQLLRTAGVPQRSAGGPRRTAGVPQRSAGGSATHRTSQLTTQRRFPQIDRASCDRKPSPLQENKQRAPAQIAEI